MPEDLNNPISKIFKHFNAVLSPIFKHSSTQAATTIKRHSNGWLAVATYPCQDHHTSTKSIHNDSRGFLLCKVTSSFASSIYEENRFQFVDWVFNKVVSIEAIVSFFLISPNNFFCFLIFMTTIKCSSFV